MVDKMRIRIRKNRKTRKNGKGIKVKNETMKLKKIIKSMEVKTEAEKRMREIKGTKASKIAKTGVIAGMLCLFAAGGIHRGYAYFSGTSEIKVNQLSIARGEQDQDGALIIVEPEWDARKAADENYAMDMQPGESAVKDPRVESQIDYPCWVFVEVLIPEESGTLEKADNPYSYVTFTGDGTDYTYGFEIVVPEINEEDWELYQRSYGKNLISYVYGCRTPLEAYGTTSPVFMSIIIPEFKQFEGGENYLFVRAKAVQTEGCETLDDAAKKLEIERKIEQTIINS